MGGEESERKMDGGRGMKEGERWRERQRDKDRDRDRERETLNQ